MNSPKIRKQYEKSLNLLTLHYGKVGQNRKLFTKYEDFYNSQKNNLNEQQKKLLSDTLKGFRLSGVHLTGDDRKLFRDSQQKLATLESKFEQNILDSSNSWELNFKTTLPLKGMPNNAIETAAEIAKSKKQSGYTLTLDQPCYMAVMTFAEDRKLRKKVYTYYASIASNEFPVKG